MGKTATGNFLRVSGYNLLLGWLAEPERDKGIVTNGPLKATLAFAAYPGVVALGIGLFVLMQSTGISLQGSAVTAVTAGAVSIVLLEWKLPYRAAWRAERSDFMNDAAYMGLVQVLLPKVLSLAVVLWLADRLHGQDWLFRDVWPHDLPVAAQAVLMVLIADFLRYWLHRASHRFEILWRLHAVHHSPKKLYWFNVGRFHPIEKALQYLLDSLPFLLLGVSDAVLASYFVFYAINGFFQHSNCAIRLGWLNYLVSGPELHRWHHSREAAESNSNYGNNFIVWDLLFGSFFLPRDRSVGDLGLINRAYPSDFGRQLITPFAKGLDKA